MRILWKSWSPSEAVYELSQMAGRLDWHDANLTQPEPGDVWLTTNGYDWRDGPFRKMTWYAESANYLWSEYENYENPISSMKWDRRFHFNPNYCVQPGTAHQRLGCWWESELKDYEARPSHKEFTFGMVLGHKIQSTKPFDFGNMRSRIVEACERRDFRYYGHGWSKDDPNYRGEVFMGDKRTPDKFRDARSLMAGAKFVFCVENVMHPHYSVNYLTEKIFHGFLARAIPIYAGCWNVENLINRRLYVDLRDFDLDPARAADHCERMPDSEWRGYMDRIDEFVHGEAKKFSFDQQLLSIDGAVRT